MIGIKQCNRFRAASVALATWLSGVVATRSCLCTSILSVLRHRAALLSRPPSPAVSAAMSSSSADSDAASASARRVAESPNGSPAGGPFQPKTSSPSMSSRQTPITPLAPLEFLQNHRRGSITDPSLHAGPSPPTFAGGPAASSISSPFRRPDSPATSFPQPVGHESRRSFSQTRPLSPYKFGEASAQPGESPSAHLRRVLRSPSADTPDRRTPTQAMILDSGREGGQAGAERNGSEGE